MQRQRSAGSGSAWVSSLLAPNSIRERTEKDPFNSAVHWPAGARRRTRKRALHLPCHIAASLPSIACPPCSWEDNVIGMLCAQEQCSAERLIREDGSCSTSAHSSAVSRRRLWRTLRRFWPGRRWKKNGHYARTSAMSATAGCMPRLCGVCLGAGCAHRRETYASFTASWAANSQHTEAEPQI